MLVRLMRRGFLVTQNLLPQNVGQNRPVLSKSPRSSCPNRPVPLVRAFVRAVLSKSPRPSCPNRPVPLVRAFARAFVRAPFVRLAVSWLGGAAVVRSGENVLSL